MDSREIYCERRVHGPAMRALLLLPAWALAAECADARAGVLAAVEQALTTVVGQRDAVLDEVSPAARGLELGLGMSVQNPKSPSPQI